MKTILQLFRKAMSWPLFLWGFVFLVWRMLSAYYWSIPTGLTTQQLTNILVALDLAGFVLGMWFLGYLFLIAIRTAAGENKPLYPLALKDSFVMGVHVIFRFIFICLPVIVLFGSTILYNKPASKQFDIISLLYLTFVFVPFCLYFVMNVKKLPYLFTWSFFKKNFDRCFLFLFLSVLSYCFLNAIFDLMYHFGLDADVYTWREVRLFLLIYVILFYLMSLNAVLLGYFAGLARRDEAEVSLLPKETVPVQEPVVAEAKTVTVKAPVATKKKVASKKKPVAQRAPVSKKSVVTKKATKKTAAKKTTAKKTAAKKTVAKKVTAKKKAKSKSVKK